MKTFHKNHLKKRVSDVLDTNKTLKKTNCINVSEKKNVLKSKIRNVIVNSPKNTLTAVATKKPEQSDHTIDFLEINNNNTNIIKKNIVARKIAIQQKTLWTQIKKIKIGVLMWYNDNIKDYAELNYKINKIYCDKHGYDLIKSSTVKYTSRLPTWEKVPMVLDNIKNYDYVVWIDADAFFYIDSPPIENIIKKHSHRNIILSGDINASSTWEINFGFFIVKNNVKTINIFNECAYNENLFSSNPQPHFHEQGVIRNMYNKNICDFKNNSIVISYGVLQRFNKDVKPIHMYGLTNKPFVYHMAGTSSGERIRESTNYYNNNCDK